jgi:Zn2+/Cd2+-exporting ATPase
LPDEALRRTQCVDCLRVRLEGRPGILEVRQTKADGVEALEVRYDPAIVTMAALEREVESAKGCLDPHQAHVMLRLTGMHSVEAERRIERELFGLPSVRTSASYSAGTVRLEFDRRSCPLPEIVRRLDRMGYRVVADASATGGMRVSRRPWVAARLALARSWALSHVELSLALLGGVALAASWVVGWFSQSHTDAAGLVAIALAVLSAVLTSTETFPEAVGTLRRFRLDVDVLMFVAAIGAASLGHYQEGALLLLLFGLGSAGEHLALSRARSSIEALTKLTPETANLREAGGTYRTVPAKEVGEGDVVLIKPFERLPVDGVVEEGAGAVDQSAVTGESVPVEKEVGSEVFAGTINAGSQLVVRCTKPASRSTLARIITMVEEAQSTKSRTQLFTDRVEAYYVPFVLLATAVLIVLPPAVGWVSWGLGFYRAMAFLTAASPCALAIGTPAAVLCAIAKAARIGVLIKGGVHLEALGTVKAVALDKTGTLTTGKLTVTQVVGDEAEVLRLGASVERASNHPLALAVLRHARDLGFDDAVAEEIEQLPAAGVRGRLDGRVVFAGKPGQLELSAELAAARGRIEADGKAIVAVGVEGKAVGLIALADTPRPAAAGLAGDLRALGVRHVAMLTGDHRGAADWVGRQAGLDAVHSELLPEDKLRIIDEMTAKHGPVAMIGDGVNDAPALAKAAVGIAMGGAGSDVAMETADVVLLSDDLSRLPAALRLGRKARRIITQNLVIALGVIAIVAPMSAFGLTKLSIAVLLHEGSTIVVVLNSLRLLRGK